jgi:hypothetical protein
MKNLEDEYKLIKILENIENLLKLIYDNTKPEPKPNYPYHPDSQPY